MVNSSVIKQEISAVDLFCGVGGLTHGLVSGGVNVVAGIDVDSTCKFPYEANNSAHFIEQDVATLEADKVNKLYKKNTIKLLTGCAPCQPFSSYSQSGRNRDYDSQWPLVLSFGRLIKEIQPELVAMENVPQLLGHDVFNEFVESLDGYEIWWSVIDCSLIGVPQTRKRLVLLASLLGEQNLSIDLKQTKVSTVMDTIGELPPINAGQTHPEDSLHMSPKLGELNMQRIKASKPGGTWREWPSSLLAECHKKSSGSTYSSVYGRMEWNKASPTITTQCFGYGNGRFGHPEQDRAISLREAAMLQTFPKNYIFSEPNEKVRFNRMGRLIGNAVPVKLGEVIANTLSTHVRKSLLSKE
mgnify:CR=1 FL=1